MKKEPSNRSDYNFFTKLSTRWNDNDIYGHMNNIIYYALFDTAVNKWLIKNNLIDIKYGKNIGLIVESGCNYFSSFQYPEDIDAGIRVTKIGTSSVRYEVGLFKEKDQISAADGFFKISFFFFIAFLIKLGLPISNHSFGEVRSPNSG